VAAELLRAVDVRAVDALERGSQTRATCCMCGRTYLTEYVFTTTPLEYAVELASRSAFRSLKIRMPRPIATGFTKMLSSSINRARSMRSQTSLHRTRRCPAALTLQLVDRLHQLTAFHTHIFALDARERLLNTTFGVSTILRAKEYSGLCAAQPPVLDEPVGHPSAEQDGIARVGDLDDAPNHASSRLRVIQSSCPSGPATNPSTVICTWSLSLRIVAMSECPVSWSHLCVESGTPNRHRGSTNAVSVGVSIRPSSYGVRRCTTLTTKAR